MKTEQEQIEEIVKILLEASKKCFDTDCDYCDKQYEKDCAQYRKAVALVQAGYGDVTEYKAENERLTKILNSLTFSKKETDIFGKPVLLMFAGVKVEEAIKRVAEYNGLKAEIERLRTTLGQCNTELNSALESLKSQCREIGELKAKIKQAQIDILNKLKKRSRTSYVLDDFILGSVVFSKDIDELIKEIEEQ